MLQACVRVFMSYFPCKPERTELNQNQTKTITVHRMTKTKFSTKKKRAQTKEGESEYDNIMHCHVVFILIYFECDRWFSLRFFSVLFTFCNWFFFCFIKLCAYLWTIYDNVAWTIHFMVVGYKIYVLSIQFYY